MNRVRMFFDRLVRRRDASRDRIRAAMTWARSDRLVAANRAVIDDLRRMERDVTTNGNGGES